METSFKKIIAGYQQFRKKYAAGENSIMQNLAEHGQQPHSHGRYRVAILASTPLSSYNAIREIYLLLEILQILSRLMKMITAIMVLVRHLSMEFVIYT